MKEWINKYADTAIIIAVGVVYVGLIILMGYFWYVEDVNKTVIKEFIRDLSNVQIATSIGIGSILVAIAAISTKSQRTPERQKEFMGIVRATFLFIFTNIAMIIMSYSSILISSTGPLLFFLGVMGGLLIFICCKTFKLGNQLLNIQ